MTSPGPLARIARNPKITWTVLAALAVLAVAVVVIGPQESTLGTGIRSVYVHVGLTATGVVGIVLAGLLGLCATAFGRPAVHRWANTLASVSLGFYIAGFITSIIAAHINWGAFFWQEPRAMAAMQTIAVGLIVQTAGLWRVPVRWHGIAIAGFATFLCWSLETTPLVLHPQNAARNSSSTAIQLTFVSVFAICIIAATWIAIWWRSSRAPEGQHG